jgi:peptide/nickel transport system substrate-binding protein
VGILPHHILQTIPAGTLLTDPFNLQPIGTGPFKLTEATDQYIRLAPNEHYRQAQAQLDPFEFRFYPTAEALLEAYQQQEIDGISRASLPLIQQLFTLPDLQFFSAPLPRYEIVYFNLRNPDAYPFFQDTTVRQALFQAIDRQSLIDQVLLGQAILARGPFLPWSWAYNPNQNYVEFDPDQARTLLDQAGWQDTDGDGIRDKDGVALRFTLLTDSSQTRGAVAADLVRQWQGLGVDVSLQVLDQNPAERLAVGQFEAALIEVQLFGDPDPYSFWHQTQIEGGQNFAGWDNTEASEALEAGRMAVARGERIKAYYQFQAIFAEEMPALILYHTVSTYAVRDTVKNVQLSALTSASDRFRNVLDWQIPAQTEAEISDTTGETIQGN